ncbi:MAG: CoA ester lyase [Alphaproteobacteria bacterium]|nr:CoA ester lyase [Alphaproteobacteria bacterium]
MSGRTLLFAPAIRPDRVAKAQTSGADMVCVDLEDAVPPPDKAKARATILEILAAPRTPGVRLGVRINAIRSAWGAADAATLADSAAEPDFVMIPKPSHAEDVAIVGEILGGAAPLWPLIESGRALARAADILSAPGVEGVLFGAADYAADVGAEIAWEPLLTARGIIAAAAGAVGVVAMDSPYFDVEDDAGLSEATRRARALGFTARACIHPRQVPVVAGVLAPNEAEIAHAHRVLAAFDAAQGGAALLDGKLVEAPLVRAAKRVLAAAGAR